MNDTQSQPFDNAQGQGNTVVTDQAVAQPVVQQTPMGQTVVAAPPDQAVQVEKPMQELVDQIERDLLAHIYTNLKENKLSGIAAQSLAKEFLALLPFKDKKDLVEKLSNLGQKYPEARETYVNLGIPIEEQERQDRLEQMRVHISSGDLDKAIEVAKGGAQNAGST